MKKTILLVTLMGMMLFSFTQHSNAKPENTVNIESLAGNSSMSTPNFEKTKKALEDAIRDTKNAKTCDDLDNVLFSLIFLDPDFDNMTSDEQDEIDRLIEELGKVYENRTKSLGCDNDDDDDEKSSSTSFSGFDSTKKALEDAIRDAKNAKTCDDLDKVLFSLIFLDPDFDSMTSDEQNEIDGLAEELGKAYENRSKSLGCNDDDD